MRVGHSESETTARDDRVYAPSEDRTHPTVDRPLTHLCLHQSEVLPKGEETLTVETVSSLGLYGLSKDREFVSNSFSSKVSHFD